MKRIFDNLKFKLQTVHGKADTFGPTYSQKFFSTAPLTSELNFLEVEVSSNLDKPLFKTPALVDTGANSCIIDLSVLKAHYSLNEFAFTPANKRSKLSLAQLGAACSIKGYINAYLTFTDNNGCKIPVRTRLIIATGLKHFLYIGGNLIYSKTVSMITKQGLHFAPNTPLYNQPNPNCVQHIVPYMPQQKSKEYVDCKGKCHTTKTIVLEPFQYTRVPCRHKFSTESFQLNQILAKPRPLKKVKAPLSILPMVYTLSNNTCDLYVMNRFPDAVTLHPNTPIASTEPFLPLDFENAHLTSIFEANDLTQDISISHISLEKDYFQCNNLFPGDSSSHFSDTLQNQLDNYGSIQLPLTDIYEKLDSNRSLNDMPMDDIPKDISHLIPMDHLRPHQQDLVKKLVQHYRSSFAHSLKELTPTHLVQLDAHVPKDIDLSKFSIKHKDIPYHQRTEVEEILRDMTQSQVVAKCTGPVLLVSNLLTRKKKSGKIRLILDNRLANAISSKIADAGSPPLLTNITEMKNSALVTLADLSNSFFQISVSNFLSSLLCFRAPDRSLYQLKRCAQGYINSSVALATTVSRMKQLPVLDKELMGIFDSSKLPNYTPTQEDIKLLSSRIPMQVLGRFEPQNQDENYLSTQPKYSCLPKHILKRSKIIEMPPETNIINYCDDIILYSNHYNKQEQIEHSNKLQTDYDDPSSPLPDHPSGGNSTPKNNYFCLPSGRKVFTDQCTYCSRNDNEAPSDADFFHHMQQFEILLLKLQKGGLKLSPAKTNIACNRIDILGSVWRPGRLSISDLRLQAFHNMKIDSAKSLHSAVSSLAYFRAQIPNFSKIARPLLDIIQNRKFVWGTVQQQAWVELLDILKQNSTIHIFDCTKPIVVSSDSSQHAAAITLTQSCHGKQRLIAAASRTFTTSEKHQSIFKKEVLSCIYAFDAFSFLLKGCKNIVLEIDSRALLYLKFCKDSNPYLTRLSLLISEFGVSKIIHVNSQCHEITDSLSRLTSETRKFKNLIESHPPMTPKEAEILVSKIAIKNGTVFEPHSHENDLHELLLGSSLPSCLPQRQKIHTTPATKTPVNFNPLYRRERTIRPPIGVSARIHQEKFRQPKYVKNKIAKSRKMAKYYEIQRTKADKKRYSMETNKPVHKNPWNMSNKSHEINVVTRSMTRNANNTPPNTEQPAPPPDTNNTDPSQPPDTSDNADNPENTLDMENDTNFDTVHLFGRILQDGILNLTTFANLQNQDPYFSKIIEEIEQPKNARKFTMKNKILFYTKDPTPRLCVPKILLVSVANQHHNSIFNCHSSFNSLLKTLNSKYFHPQLKEVAKKVCKNCLLCEITLTHPHRESPLGTLATGQKRQLWYCDLALIGQSPPSYLFIAVDSLSLFVFATALKDKSESSLYKAILTLAGTFMASNLKFDNEAGIFPLIDKLKLLGIAVEFTAVGSSFSNGIAEKRIGMSKEICRILRAMKSDLTHDELATLISQNLNRKIVTGARLSPEQIMFNNSLSLPHEIIHMATDHTDSNEVTPLFEKSVKDYIKHRQDRAKTQREKHNWSRRQTRFSVGDLVWVSNRNLIVGQKGLKVTRSGPYIVEKIENSGHTAVLRHITTKSIIKRRISYLSNAQQDFTNILVNDAWPNQILDNTNDTN